MAQIALTTVFTPPASCFDNSYTLYGSPVYVKDVQVQSLECYPEGFRALWSVGVPFSPGVCPEFYVGASSSDGEGDETRVLCCPGSMTAHHDEMGCFMEVHSETALALPTGVVTVKGAMLAMHGILVEWASSDSSVLPAMPSSSLTTRPVETSSDEQHEVSTTRSTYALPTSNAMLTHTRTITPLIAITESTTEKAESQMSDGARGATSLTQDALTPEASFSSPPTSITSASPPAAASATPRPSHHLPPGAIAGISISTAASIAILAGLAALAIRFRRQRRRARMHSSGVDVRVFDSASEYHEDKRRWSQLSSSFGTVSRSGSGRTDVSAADSSAVVMGVAELEGS